jgi:hypothetical protein
MTNTELLKVRPVAAVRGAARTAVAPAATTQRPAEQDPWAGVKTLLEIGFAVVRVVEIALLVV